MFSMNFEGKCSIKLVNLPLEPSHNVSSNVIKSQFIADHDRWDLNLLIIMQGNQIIRRGLCHYVILVKLQLFT